MGRKKQPYFRVVVAKRDAPRDGAYIDELGFYNPRTRPAFLTMDLDKVDAWIGKGASVSDSAMSLIRKARKGGDGDIAFVKPGEDAPRLKTATKPERRPQSAPAESESEAEAAEADATQAKAEEPEAGAKPEAEEPEAEAEAKAEEPETEEPKAEAKAEADEPKAEAKPKAEEPKAEAKAKAEEPKAES
ncbi:MAG: 30S ribosomal protein S16, partial [Gemmatimonadota bacterium]